MGTKNSSKKGQGQSDEIRAQALANVRAARENLGQDTIDKIAEMIKKMESSEMKQAQTQIQDVDPDRVLDELKWMMDNRD